MLKHLAMMAVLFACGSVHAQVLHGKDLPTLNNPADHPNTTPVTTSNSTTTTPTIVTEGPNIEAESAKLAGEIRSSGFFLNGQQRQQIEDHITAIRGILFGSTTKNYACVSRDNDGLFPFLLGVRNGVDFKKFDGAVYPTLADCNSAIQSMRISHQYSIACTSRDADGSHPWILIAINEQGSFTRLVSSAVDTLQQCESGLKQVVIGDTQALYCGSKDESGMRPFVSGSFNFETTEARAGAESFSSISECFNFLNGTR